MRLYYIDKFITISIDIRSNSKYLTLSDVSCSVNFIAATDINDGEEKEPLDIPRRSGF